MLSGKWSGIYLPQPARVPGGKNIIGKQLATTIEDAGKAAQ